MRGPDYGIPDVGCAMNLIEASMGELVTLIVIAVVIAVVAIAAGRKGPKAGGTNPAAGVK